jgi:hypothetical protein
MNNFACDAFLLADRQTDSSFALQHRTVSFHMSWVLEILYSVKHRELQHGKRAGPQLDTDVPLASIPSHHTKRLWQQEMYSPGTFCIILWNFRLHARSSPLGFDNFLFDHPWRGGGGGRTLLTKSRPFCALLSLDVDCTLQKVPFLNPFT